MSKLLKAVAALCVFVAIYFLVSGAVFLVIYVILGSPTNWQRITVGTFANAWAAGFGVYAAHALLDKYLAPYPARFVGIAFIALLGLWFVPLTLIYVSGAIAIFFGGADMGDWPPEGELGEYFLGLVRAIVAVICAWATLVKR